MKLTQQDYTPAIMTVEDAPTDTDLKIRVSYWTGANAEQNGTLFHDTIVPEIVKRFNAYEELLDALETVTEHCRITIKEYRRFANEHGVDAIHPLDDPILNKAMAAINKAKGRE